MNTPHGPNRHARAIRRLRLAQTLGLLSLAAALPAGAANYLWDPLGSSGPSDGSGNWHDANSWWNGSSVQSWADNNQATIGAGTPGHYTINVESTVNTTLLVFTNAGSYTLTNSRVSLVTGGSAVGTTGVGMYVANGVTLTTSNVIGSGLKQFLGTNSTWNVLYGWSLSGNPPFTGAGYTNSTLNLVDGMFAGAGNLILEGVTINQFGGTNYAGSGGKFELGRNASGSTSQPGGMCVYNFSGGVISGWGNHFSLCRDTTGNPSGIFNMSGGQLNLSGQGTDGAFVLNQNQQPAAGCQAIVNFSGGTMNIGTGPSSGLGANTAAVGVNDSHLNMISLFSGANSYPNASSAIFNMSGGTLTAKAITFGYTGGTFTANPTNQLNVTGGTLYLATSTYSALGQIVNTGTNFGVNLSGGTIAAIAKWSPACSIPINLTNINGSITFQAADASGTAYVMSFTGRLTGVGGFNKTGSGTLTLSGANNYSGATVISNGTLVIQPVNFPTNGAVTLNGSAAASGAPTNSVQLTSAGQYWAVGTLTYAGGSPTADFNFDGVTPSASSAPILVNGDLKFSVTPQITIEGTAIPSGRYPLIKYTGSLSGTVPASVASMPGYFSSASIVNNSANKSIDLVVVSSFNPILTWGVGNGNWDFSSLNWKQSGNAVAYSDGATVQFDDTATGASPINITLNTAVQPAGVLAFNATKNYAVTGTGSIGGSTSVNVSGTGTLTLAGKNTYSGGTVVNSGQLNINNGGDGGADSAIGTGPLTLMLGSKIDNTSGAPVTLLANNSLVWNDDFTFVGSTNLDMGQGQVTLGSVSVTLTVGSNSLTVNNPIAESSPGYGLTKTGNGTLTLSNNNNNFTGGLTLAGGKLNINCDGAAGNGAFNFNSGVLDNTSGSDFRLSRSQALNWNGDFTFQGTTNLNLGDGTLVVGAPNVNLTVASNTLTTEGNINGGNRQITKLGRGVWTLAGSGNNSSLGLAVSNGTLNLSKDPGAYAMNFNTLSVSTNGRVVFMGGTGRQLGTGGVPILLAGGTIDLNGDNEGNVANLTFNAGTLQNSAPGTAGEVGNNIAGVITLGSTNCFFDASSEDNTLNIDKVITGAGALTKTGPGRLVLQSPDGTNSYTGSTLVAAGTLALVEPNTITNSAAITIAAGATLDTTSRGDQSLTLLANQTLSGSGTLNGNLAAGPGSTVSPGSGIGTLTVNNNISLSGRLVLELNRTNAQKCDQLVSASGSISYGGTLLVTNIGPTLQVGDAFRLFPAAVPAGSFSQIALATTDASGATYTWSDKTAVDGSVVVTKVTSINPNPGTIQYTLNGNTLNLAWPTNGGWVLLAQTNPISVGLSTNWVVVSGSTSVTNLSFTVYPTNGTLFFRMVHP